MINVGFDGRYYNTDRNVVNELCDKHKTEIAYDALSLAQYRITLKLGDPGIAAAEVYEKCGAKNEFFAIIIVTFGFESTVYTVETMHALILLLKDINPIIESTVRLQSEDLKA